MLPRAVNPARCPVAALESWRTLARIHTGPLLRPVGKSNTSPGGWLHPESINTLVQKAVARAGLDLAWTPPPPERT